MSGFQTKVYSDGSFGMEMHIDDVTKEELAELLDVFYKISEVARERGDD